MPPDSVLLCDGCVGRDRKTVLSHQPAVVPWPYQILLLFKLSNFAGNPGCSDHRASHIFATLGFSMIVTDPLFDLASVG